MGFGALSIGRRTYGSGLFKVKCTTQLLNQNEPEPVPMIANTVRREKKYIPGERLLKKINRAEENKKKREKEKKTLNSDDIDRLNKSMSNLLKMF